MFKKIEPLNHDDHQALRFAKTDSYDFAREVVSAPLGASEFAMAGRFYPIVFATDSETPLAIFALGQPPNRFIAENGAWAVPYVPAHIRRYPFILADIQGQEEEEAKLALCVDVEAPQFSAGMGEPLFTANGDPAETTQNALNFLKNFQAELNTTKEAFKELTEQGLLVDRQVNVERNGEQIPVAKFRVVDAEKLGALDDAVLAKWVRNGMIRLIHSHLDSLAHLRSLAS